MDYCKKITDVEAMKKASKKISNNGRNMGMFGGVIGVLDGWLVKIKCPNSKRNKVTNFGSFYCRKGHCALNVQAIVDRNKMIIWCSVKCRSSEHDSTAFKSTSLYKTLIGTSSELLAHGFYFLGDSAYVIRPFLITVYDNAKHGTTEDAFDSHLSFSRIFIECAFG